MKSVALLLVFSTSFASAFDICVQKRLKVDKLCGYVVDPDGVPVLDADISVVNEKGEKTVRRTEKEGKFQFDGLPAGRYELRANYMDAMNAWAQIEVSKGRSSKCQRPLKVRMKAGIPHTCSEVSIETKSHAASH